MKQMRMRYLSILLLYFSCFSLWFCAPVFAGQNRLTAESTFSANNEINSNTQKQPRIQELTLEKAVAAALENNPDLNVSKFNTRVAESDKQQASFFPNPELGFEYEDFNHPERTLAIGYLIELGGKRGHRMKVADAGVELADIEFDAARVDTIYETANAFIDVLIAQESLRITKEKEKLAEQVYATSIERVLAGRVSPMEQVTAEIKRNNSSIEVQIAEDELLIARTNLAAMWGGSTDDFRTAGGAFDCVQAIPPFETLTAVMENAPIIRAKLAEIKLAETSLDLEKSNRIPDLTIAGGIKDVDEEDDTIYLVGLSIPIPLFDRNQAGIARAAAEVDQQAAALSAEKKRLLKDLKIAYQTLKTAYQQVNTIKTDILPAAQRVLDAVKEGYREGAFSFLDMLEAQSTLYESHESYVQSLGKYHIAVIDLEKVLGRNLSSFNCSDQAMAQSFMKN
jgi:cobalt-zinc-cadmium efflux system outer membrane protein